MALVYETLRSVSFLADAGADEVARLVRVGRSVSCTRGHLFWRAGALPDHVLFPITGEAKAVSLLADGRELIDRIVGPGDSAGVFGALDGLPQPHFVEAVRDGEFLLVPRRSFVWFLDREPVVRLAVLREMGRVYRRSLRERTDVVFLEAAERLARYLVENACVRAGDGARVLVHDTRAEMAQRLGMAPEVVSRVLRPLVARGFIARTKQGTTFITDWRGLRDVAGLDPADGEESPPDAAPAEHTRRFFLPLTEPGARRELAKAAAECRARTANRSLCRTPGCPLAEEDAAFGRVPVRSVGPPAPLRAVP
jgi:CRP-like cAMP-binding protein